MKYSIVYNAYCCDTGYFTRYYKYRTLLEAKTFYEEWKEDMDRGNYWSDGPEHMSIQRLEYCPSCKRDQILESEMVNSSRGRICECCLDNA